ncbi:MAG: IS1634 family transposase, partial [Bacilli bacterium]
MDKYVELYNPKQIAEISNANGRTPVYEIEYKGTRIEDSFRIIKSDLEGRPIYVRTEAHIKAHFLIYFI